MAEQSNPVRDGGHGLTPEMARAWVQIGRLARRLEELADDAQAAAEALEKAADAEQKRLQKLDEAKKN